MFLPACGLSRAGRTAWQRATRSWPILAWAAALALFDSSAAAAVPPAVGQSPSPAGAVTVGIEGHYRVGYWTGVRASERQTIELVETRDGDGLQVEYAQVPQATWAYAIPGSEAAPLRVRGAATQWMTRFPALGAPARGPSMIPRTMPWIVALGDPLGIDTIGANALLGRDASVAVTRPSSAAGLPDSVLGYQGVDLIVIGREASGLLAALDERQRQALRRWVTGGGQILATLGASAPQVLSAAPWLQELLSLDEISLVPMNPSALETYLSAQTPLEPFVGLSLPPDRGQVMLMGRTQRRVPAPLVVRYNTGFGQITVVAADLDEALFAAWPERMDLVKRLTGTLLQDLSGQRSSGSRATAYDDLAGQLRAALDRFPAQRRYNFSVVSLILLALIAAIGPLDYLLVNRLLGRPLLGWLTFPIAIVGLSALLIAQSRTVDSSPGTEKQASLHSNRLEIFDIDPATGQGRGFVASYLYTHQARRLDLRTRTARSLDVLSGPVQPLVTASLGTAGRVFGGVPIAVDDVRLPPYQVEFSAVGDWQATRMAALPMAARSSKGIECRLRFQPQFGGDVTMRRRPGSELLQGELINPLPLDLLDGMLIYRNWAYLLPTRLPAQGRIPSVAALRQKNFRWLLTRQQALEASQTQTEPWDPTRVDSLERIAQILMFHQAAGGTGYTSLRNDPLADLDLSHALAADRCLLVGRLAEPLTELVADSAAGAPAAGQTTAISQDTLSLVRVVIPVRQEIEE